MGAIVGGIGTGHILMRRGTAGEEGERAFQGMQETGRRIRQLKPDVVVIVSSDHFYNLHGNDTRPFQIGAEAAYTTYGDMDIPIRTLPGSPTLAREIANEAQRQGFPLSYLSSSYRPDHGVALPYLMISLPDIPLVPIISNLALAQVPSMVQGWELGGIIRSAVQRNGRSERVVIVGAGGLSHWLGVPEMGRVNPEWDRAIMQAMVSGKARELTTLSSDAILRDGGNGGLEILNWEVMAGALPLSKGEEIYYEPLPTWMTGLGGVELHA